MGFLWIFRISKCFEIFWIFLDFFEIFWISWYFFEIFRIFAHTYTHIRRAHTHTHTHTLTYTYNYTNTHKPSKDWKGRGYSCKWNSEVKRARPGALWGWVTEREVDVSVWIEEVKSVIKWSKKSYMHSFSYYLGFYNFKIFWKLFQIFLDFPKFYSRRTTYRFARDNMLSPTHRQNAPAVKQLSPANCKIRQR
jgi:hypothetical protein